MSTEHEAKSLEMRVAAIEDKLAKINVTAEEMRSYQKVASLTAGATHSGFSPHIPSFIHTGITSIHRPITISIPISIPTPIIVNDCIQAAASGPAASTGFEALGKK